MKLLVTGSAGFIGRHVVRWAQQRGHKVIGIDKREGRDVRTLHPFQMPPDLVDGVEAIIHLAANCSTPRSIQHPWEDFQDNAWGTFAVLEFARLRRLPVIYTSTCKVYAAAAVNALEGRPVDERVSVVDGARSPYGTSKLTGELYCQEYHELYGVPVVINRLSSVFGPEQDGTEEAGWLYWFTRAKAEGLPITIYGTGRQVRDPIWVEDLCGLLLEQVETPKPFAGQVFNVGGGTDAAVDLLSVIVYLDRKGGTPLPVRFEAARPADLNVYISDMTRLFARTAWRPSTSVWQGLDRLHAELTRSPGARKTPRAVAAVPNA